MNARTVRKRHILRLRRRGIVVIGYDPAWLTIISSYSFAISENLRAMATVAIGFMDRVNETLRQLRVNETLGFELVPPRDPGDTRDIPILPGWKESTDNVRNRTDAHP